jgi:hypothetical protein
MQQWRVWKLCLEKANFQLGATGDESLRTTAGIGKVWYPIPNQDLYEVPTPEH